MILFNIKTIDLCASIHDNGNVSQEKYERIRLEIFLALRSKKFHLLKQLTR
jgi:hypothetical protein